MALTQEQFMQLMGGKREPVTASLASVLDLIKKPLDYYSVDKRVPLVGGQSAADLIGLTGTQSLVQDFSQGKPMMRDGLPDERFIDAASMIPMIKPAAVGAGKAAKYLGKEALRQGYEGTGLLGKIAPDMKMYAYDPKNANLGSNFERTTVGKKIAPKEFNPEDWKGASIVTHPIDRTGRNTIVTEVSGIPIDPKYQFITEGGIGFGEDADLAAKNIIMASTKNAMVGAYNRALKAQEQNLAKGGSGRVLVNPNVQSELGYNFSTMPTELINSLVKSQGMTSKQVAPIDEMVRKIQVGDKKPFADWIGLADSGALEQLQTGQGFSGLPSDLRKAVLNKATSVTGQKIIGFNEPDFRLALTDPRLTNAQKHDLGLLWYEMDLARPPQPSNIGSGHKTYNYDAFGTNVGSTPVRSTKDVYGNVYENIFNRMPSVSPKTGAKISEDTRAQNTIHSLRDLHDESSLFLDNEQIQRLKKLFNQ
jgi:hypothetical protein